METKKLGKCSACDTPVLKIINSDMPTCRIDGVRFTYPGTEEKGWCVFRCKECHSVIETTWEAIESQQCP